MPTPAIEEYLESIYKLRSRVGRVIGARLAEDLGVAPPTVTEMLRRLRLGGFVDEGANKEILLTREGERAAEVLIRRHRLSERLLTDILGMPWSQAHDEACKFEHVISPAVEANLARVLDYPTTCPHGNPIPAADGEKGSSPEELCRLSDLWVGARAVLRCVQAEGEDFLVHIEELRLVPGVELEVIDFVPPGGPMRLRLGKNAVSLGIAAAEKLLVRLEE